jgi:porin
VTLLAGVFNGSPAPSNEGDAQKLNRSGTSFPLNGGVLAIAELQYTAPTPGTMADAGHAGMLPHTYRIGAWFDSESFDDQLTDTSGVVLADPLSNGTPRRHHGDFGLYAVADQVVWADAADPEHNVSLFGRVMSAPQADRNLVTFALNAGLTVHEPFAGRTGDTFGLGLGYARVGSAAAALDRATAIATRSFVPARGGETFIEATYQYQVAPWWVLQPDLQYVFNPGGGVADLNAPERRVRNELVLGLRTTLQF